MLEYAFHVQFENRWRICIPRLFSLLRTMVEVYGLHAILPPRSSDPLEKPCLISINCIVY